MIVVYDACVLYPSPLRDFLIRVAIEDLVVARWSDRILDEVFRSVSRDRPDLQPVRLQRFRTLIKFFGPTIELLSNHETRIPSEDRQLERQRHPCPSD